MVIRNPEIITDDRVTVRESDLLEAVCIALEGDEFIQITDGRMYGEGNQACAYGVAKTIGARAGFTMDRESDWDAVAPLAIVLAACHHLGYPTINAANDAGVTFPQISQALRQAREEMQRV